jgi:hypothetical protein
MSAAFLQSYIVSICLCEDRGTSVALRSHVGTAFFFSKAGYFMTARHVVEEAIAKSISTGLRVGLAVKGEHGSSEDTEVHLVDDSDFENCPDPFDIAVGHVSYFVDTPLLFREFAPSLWQEVATLGYPASAIVPEGDGFWANLRAQRGYIQRATIPRDIHIGDHPNGFELSFVLSAGMSGCPIFTPDQMIIGVGVSTIQSELLDAEFTEVSEDGATYHERKVKLEQFGFAHDTSSLLNWSAEIFEGRTLLEVSMLPQPQTMVISVD